MTSNTKTKEFVAIDQNEMPEHTQLNVALSNTTHNSIKNDERNHNVKTENTKETVYEKNITTPLSERSCNINFPFQMNSNQYSKNVKLNQLIENFCGPNMTCLECQKPFKQRAHLQRHIKEQHLAQQPDHVFYLKKKKMNLALVYTFITKIFYVNVLTLQQAFHQKANLMCHMLTHLKNRVFTHPFHCLLCEEKGLERKFTRKSSLRRHVETKHPSCDKDASWISTQKKPKIVKQLCDNLNSEKKHSIKSSCLEALKPEVDVSSEVVHPIVSNYGDSSVLVFNNDQNISDNCNVELSQIFPEMFLFQNPELFDQFLSSDKSSEAEQWTESEKNQQLMEVDTDLPPLIPVIGSLIKNENEIIKKEDHTTAK
ncbi:hypothetical protein RFI_28446 [Reticulomyxa filosa]|uniref:C2H2-type domain-containing protein n=1 Tax=Reticulomyxa filosa TaxID=46433 RepID=X6M7D8_RETFI|nr:hypothetical protein RFI_28446 [Reticulomyxa filosa]|eukprot:ETO08940.1 hypothetical protein RFI_28446 [Reticulomyxa filosa]